MRFFVIKKGLKKGFYDMDREKTKIKRDNFVTVQGWMILDLDLKGNELLIYACIYGFTQTDSQWFTGNRQYLADWTNSTKQGVQKCLNSLVAKGLLEKREKYENGVKFCEYRATEFTSQQSLPGVGNKVDWGSQQSLPGVGNKVDWGSQQSLPNNIYINNIDNINNNSQNISRIEMFEEFWEVYPKQIHRALAEHAYIESLIKGSKEEWLVEAAKEYAKCVNGEDQRYIKNPENWLKEDLYLDYPPGTYEKRCSLKNNNNGKGDVNNGQNGSNAGNDAEPEDMVAMLRRLEQGRQ